MEGASEEGVPCEGSHLRGEEGGGGGVESRLEGGGEGGNELDWEEEGRGHPELNDGQRKGGWTGGRRRKEMSLGRGKSPGVDGEGTGRRKRRREESRGGGMWLVGRKEVEFEILVDSLIKIPI